jgi:CHASE1-domain containing sensor protein
MGAARDDNVLAKAINRASQAGPALFVLLLGLALSSIAWRFAAERVTGEAEIKFQHQVAQAVGALDRRIQDNINLLVGLSGLFAASNRIDRDEFQRYLSGFNVPQHYPGVRLISFVRHVRHEEKDAFEASVRSDRSLSPGGYPEFAVKPPGVRE